MKVWEKTLGLCFCVNRLPFTFLIDSKTRSCRKSVLNHYF